MNGGLTGAMVDALERVRKGPATAHDIDVHPGVLISLSTRGLLHPDRKRHHPNIYRLTPKGEAFIELLHQPIVITPQDGMVVRIQKAVALHYGVPVEEMRSSRRGDGVARHRQVAMYLTRQMTPLSLPNIGRRFGKRDHTTVLHAIRKVEQLVRTDPGIAADVKALREALGG